MRVSLPRGSERATQSHTSHYRSYVGTTLDEKTATHSPTITEYNILNRKKIGLVLFFLNHSVCSFLFLAAIYIVEMEFSIPQDSKQSITTFTSFHVYWQYGFLPVLRMPKTYDVSTANNTVHRFPTRRRSIRTSTCTLSGSLCKKNSHSVLVLLRCQHYFNRCSRLRCETDQQVQASLIVGFRTIIYSRRIIS